MGLMGKCGMLDKGYQVYFDNYYSSMELVEELCARYTFACGTVCSNRPGLPAAVTKSKLKKGQTVFQHKDAILCMKCYDRREVCLVHNS